MTRAILLTVTCLAACAAPGRAQTTRSLIADVIEGATSDTDRAIKLLAAAKLVTDEPAAMVALLSEAADYGLKAGRSSLGAQAALEALKLLAEAAPDKSDLWQARRLQVYRVRFKATAGPAKVKAAGSLLDALLDLAARQEQEGKWTQARATYQEAHPVASALRTPLLEVVVLGRTRAAHFEKAAADLEAESKKLAASPANTAAREKALELLMAELDRPAEAAKLLTPEVAESWRAFVPLAAKDPNGLTEAGAGELGRWLSQFLAPKASKYSKMRIMLAAHQCAEQAVALHTNKDAELVARKSALQKIETELDGLAGTEAAAARTRYAEILKLLDPSLLRGTSWVLARGVLTLAPRRRDPLKLPAGLDGDYQLSIRFAVGKPAPVVKDKRGRVVRTGTSRGLNLAFPVGDNHLELSVAAEATETRGTLREIAAGRATGLTGSTTITTAALTPGRAYQLDLIVFVRGGFAIVKADLDRRPLVRWQGKASRCKLSEYWRDGLRPGSIALAAWKGPTTFASIKLRSLGGRMKLWRPEPQP
jgi:hypothetical protein